jgi:hypothetical protein
MGCITRRDFLQYALNAGFVLGAAGLGANPTARWRSRS